MNVGISIKSESADGPQSYFVDGEFVETQDGFALSYKLDGDDNRLVYDGKSVCQSRIGSFTYSVRFTEGKKCSFLFSEAGCNFYSEVYVSLAEARSFNHGCMVKIIYSDSENSQSVTKICVTAKFRNQ